jgi:hypothetical protein
VGGNSTDRDDLNGKLSKIYLIEALEDGDFKSASAYIDAGLLENTR